MKPMLAKEYCYENPVGWWMSEKLDGVRAVWDGSEFKSRNGKVFPAPDHIKQAMPDTILDGELFCGRGKFQTTISNVRRGEWQDITYKVFDVIDSTPFEARQATLTALTLPAWCEVVEQVLCASHEHLEQYEHDLITLGAEGVMIRKPQSLYKHSRSSDLLKIKRFQSAEAEIVGYEQGKGKHAGRVGALVASFCGEIFKIGTGLSNDQRETPPAIGSVVTFSFFELTDAGKPRFASFMGVRDYE
jgi:DNA ligase-1